MTQTTQIHDIKTINLKLMAVSENSNDRICHILSSTFNLKRSTTRLLRYLLGRYAVAGYVEDSINQLSKELPYTYKTLHKAFTEMVSYGILTKGRDQRFYFHGGILQGLGRWTFEVSVPGGYHPVPDR